MTLMEHLFYKVMIHTNKKLCNSYHTSICKDFIFYPNHIISTIRITLNSNLLPSKGEILHNVLYNLEGCAPHISQPIILCT